MSKRILEWKTTRLLDWLVILLLMLVAGCGGSNEQSFPSPQTSSPVATATQSPAVESQLSPSPQQVAPTGGQVVSTPQPNQSSVSAGQRNTVRNVHKKNKTKTTQSLPSPTASLVASGTPLRSAVSGSCKCPYDTDKQGRACGGRSAHDRPGGAHPKCYKGE